MKEIVAKGLGFRPQRPHTKLSHAAEVGRKGADRRYTLEEVAQHNTQTDCWVVVNGLVLEVTDFMSEHPGGRMALLAWAGQDATEAFNAVHEADSVHAYAAHTIVGKLKESSKL